MHCNDCGVCVCSASASSSFPSVPWPTDTYRDHPLVLTCLLWLLLGTYGAARPVG